MEVAAAPDEVPPPPFGAGTGRRTLGARRRRRRIVGRLLLATAGAGVAAVAVTFAQAALLNLHNPKRTALMSLRVKQAAEQGRTLRVRHTWVPLKELPSALPRAVVAAEDGRFYKHRGFDWEAIQAALKHNQARGRIRRGGSTITQQLAKNLYLSPRRSYIRKIREAFITLALEATLSKARILELYLNLIEFGPGVFGVEEGAKYHFGVSARRLNVDQACRLAAIIPAPLRYRVNGPYVVRRAAAIRAAM